MTDKEEKEVKATKVNKVVEDETVAIQMLRNCQMFQAQTDGRMKGRPQALILQKGSVHSMKRSQLKEIILLDLVKSKSAANQHSKPELYIMLGR